MNVRKGKRKYLNLKRNLVNVKDVSRSLTSSWTSYFWLTTDLWKKFKDKVIPEKRNKVMKIELKMERNIWKLKENWWYRIGVNGPHNTPSSEFDTYKEFVQFERIRILWDISNYIRSICYIDRIFFVSSYCCKYKIRRIIPLNLNLITLTIIQKF